MPKQIQENREIEMEYIGKGENFVRLIKFQSKHLNTILIAYYSDQALTTLEEKSFSTPYMQCVLGT
jgi:hypothetical protein